MTFFVTGGSGGIGGAIVLDALRRGHDVAFTMHEDAPAAEALLAEAARIAPAQRCRSYPLDVRDSADVEKVADAVLEDFEDVHALVINAGITTSRVAANMTDEEWRAVIDTNLTGAFFVCRQFLPALLANRFGRIIFMSSISHRGFTGHAAYAASKAGLLGLSATLAKEYGRRGITSNVVAPGAIETGMTTRSLSDTYREWWLKFCPVGRLGRAEEVARLVTFLASEEAAFINGQAIDIDGGTGWPP
ncbi:MAG: 3-oxoacyl-[acyl-carrier protein] reductase [Chthoniobacter sp.]|jgi:NAD(P)-dependent dehydrogenase (short-subunit alcohol dehydrogenase family)|nr:3-oxoacyl-[acyl-carrier protein] reductase [Chthoniobacter sp.]